MQMMQKMKMMRFDNGIDERAGGSSGGGKFDRILIGVIIQREIELK